MGRGVRSFWILFLAAEKVEIIFLSEQKVKVFFAYFFDKKVK